MDPQYIEGLLTIVICFGAFTLAGVIGYALYALWFRYMVKNHRDFMEEIIPDYFIEKDEPN